MRRIVQWAAAPAFYLGFSCALALSPGPFQHPETIPSTPIPPGGVMTPKEEEYHPKEPELDPDDLVFVMRDDQTRPVPTRPDP